MDTESNAIDMNEPAGVHQARNTANVSSGQSVEEPSKKKEAQHSPHYAVSNSLVPESRSDKESETPVVDASTDVHEEEVNGHGNLSDDELAYDISRNGEAGVSQDIGIGSPCLRDLIVVRYR